MSDRPIAIGTRCSALALAQARLVQDAFARDGRATRIVEVETAGDRRAPDTAWGEGAFVVAIERALLDGRVDLAVHSAKDIPTRQDPRLRIAAYLPRADPRDALIVRRDATAWCLADLPPGTRIGTDSPRRTGFLLARRPDLIVHPLHGNVDTRLGRLDAGETDALVLACAGLDRLGLGGRIAERLEAEIVPPAPGQGAIAVQIRRDDARMLNLAASIDDSHTRLAVEAERALLAAAGGGCRAPIGALAVIVGNELDLLGGAPGPDGSPAVFGRRRGPLGSGEDLAGELAVELDVRGLARQDAGGDPPRPRSSGRRVLVTRATAQADGFMTALRHLGLDPIGVPAIAIEFDPPQGDLDRAAAGLHSYRWVIVTSANGARAILEAAERIRTELGAPDWAVIGPATRVILEREGVEVRFQPSTSDAMALATELPLTTGDRVLIVRGDLADEGLAERLSGRGAEVDDVIAYRTIEAPKSSRQLLRQAMRDEPLDAIVLTSGSTVRGLLMLARAEALDITAVPAVCIGPNTGTEAARAGFRVIAVSSNPDAIALAAATAQALTREPQEVS